ncbi:MAG: hypothetical protein HQK85_06545 [Nitrospinae bacterium]|nr:hypothetical protein [Nitrospinota bacterium]
MSDDILRLLPQKPPMVFITGVRKTDEHSATCWFDITGQTPFVRNGVLNEAVLIEVAAQTTSVHFHQSRSQEAQSEGYIIEVKNFTTGRPLKVGERIVATATVVKILPPFGMYDVEIFNDDGEKLGAGLLKFYKED